MLINLLKYKLAGLWPLVWHFGTGGAIVIACVALYLFEPAWMTKFFPRIHKALIWIAITVLVFMVGTGLGVSLGEKRIQAQWSAALIAEVDAGEADRNAAVAAVPDTADRGVFNDDPDNRDRNPGTIPAKPKSKVRWPAAHHLFGKR